MTLGTTLRLMVREHALMNVKDTAEAMGHSEWWVRQLISRGELRAINVGGTGRSARWRVDPEDLEALMRSRENRPRDLIA